MVNSADFFSADFAEICGIDHFAKIRQFFEKKATFLIKLLFFFGFARICQDRKHEKTLLHRVSMFHMVWIRGIPAPFLVFYQIRGQAAPKGRQAPSLVFSQVCGQVDQKRMPAPSLESSQRRRQADPKGRLAPSLEFSQIRGQSDPKESLNLEPDRLIWLNTRDVAPMVWF